MFVFRDELSVRLAVRLAVGSALTALFFRQGKELLSARVTLLPMRGNLTTFTTLLYSY